MKFKRFVFLGLAVLSLGLMGCAGSNSSAAVAPATTTATATASTAAATTASAAAPAGQQYNIPLQMSCNGKTMGAAIEANHLTQQLLDRTPVSFTLQRLGSYNFVYGDKAIQASGDFKRGMNKGAIAYCRYGYLIIFQGDQAAGHPDDFIKVGQINPEDFAALEQLEEGQQLTISRL